MRLLIVEDEPLVARRLERFCRELLGDTLTLLRCAPSFEAAAGDLDTIPFEVVLLDLNLHGSDGMELLRTAAAGSFFTIIVSANIDRALEAFEVGVLDFVPKPFTKERLGDALERVRRLQGVRPARRLAIRETGRLSFVDLDAVHYVKAAGAYSELVLHSGKTVLHDKSLDRLGALLPPNFERIHKSYLVRLETIQALQVQEGSRYFAELVAGTFLPVGRTRVQALRERLGEAT